MRSLFILLVFYIGNIKSNANTYFGSIMYDDEYEGMSAYVYKIDAGSENEPVCVSNDKCVKSVLHEIVFSDLKSRIDTCIIEINKAMTANDYEATKIDYRYAGLELWKFLTNEDTPEVEAQINSYLKEKSISKSSEFFSLIDAKKHADYALHYFVHKGKFAENRDAYLSFHKDILLVGYRIYYGLNDIRPNEPTYVTIAEDETKNIYEVIYGDFKKLNKIPIFFKGPYAEINGTKVDNCNVSNPGMILNVWNMKTQKTNCVVLKISEDDIDFFPLLTDNQSFDQNACRRSLVKTLNEKPNLLKLLSDIPDLIFEEWFDILTVFTIYSEYATTSNTSLDSLKTNLDRECENLIVSNGPVTNQTLAYDWKLMHAKVYLRSTRNPSISPVNSDIGSKGNIDAIEDIESTADIRGNKKNENTEKVAKIQSTKYSIALKKLPSTKGIIASVCILVFVIIVFSAVLFSIYKKKNELRMRQKALHDEGVAFNNAEL